jgi:multidrug efflux pump subunit AcrB
VKISEFAVKRPQFTLVVFACLAMLGFTMFKAIPRAEDPYFPIPVFTVVAIYPGASSRQLEQEVVRELEEKISAIAELKKTVVRISDSAAIMIVQFNTGVDSSKKNNELLRQVEAARSNLPLGVTSVEVKQSDTSTIGIMQVALLVPTAPWQQVEPVAQAVERQLEGISGVKEVTVRGIPDIEATVAVNQAQLANAGIPVERVFGAIAGGNVSIPGADVELGARRFTVQTSGALRSLDELRTTVVGGDANSALLVEDIAGVAIVAAPPSFIFRYQGQRAALITIAMRQGENIFAVVENVKKKLATIAPTLPAGMKFEVGFDQSKNVEHRLGGLQRDFIIAIGLVLITLIPLGFRAALLVMISIPMSLAIGVSALSLLGYSLNQLSIVGFVIALGLLVDDSIVVAENIARWMRNGATRQQAAIAATKQIGVAVLGCTATLVFAFVPLLFLPGNAGDFIRSLPVAVVVTILASLFVSLTLIPFLASRFLRDHDEHGNAAFRIMSRGIERVYRPVLRLVMNWRKTTLIASVFVVAAAISLVPRIGFSLFPKAGIPQFLINIKTPDGTSLARTQQVAERVEALLRNEPEVASIMSATGGGLPEVYYNRSADGRGANVADVLGTLHAYRPSQSAAWFDRLRKNMAEIPGAEISLREFENGPPVTAPIEIRIIGDDLDTLRTIAGEVSSKLKGVANTRDIRNPLAIRRTDLQVVTDDRIAGLVGVTSTEVDRATRMAIRGVPVGMLHRAALDDIPIVVTGSDGLLANTMQNKSEPPTLASLDYAQVNTASGGSVPVDAVAHLQLSSAAGAINHYNRERYVSVTAEVADGANVAEVSKHAMAMMSGHPLPPGYRWQAGGLVESQAESFAGLGPAILIAVFGILAVLVLEFGSFSATLIVAAVIPFGIAGGLVALFIAGETLSFTASIGFIALTGIEVKNSLLLVDFTEQLRNEGMSIEDAVRKAGEVRFFPILLTSMTAIGGLLPLVFEHSALYSPLAIVLVGGLISSTLLSRLITPVLSVLLLKSTPAAEPIALG